MSNGLFEIFPQAQKNPLKAGFGEDGVGLKREVNAVEFFFADTGLFCHVAYQVVAKGCFWAINRDFAWMSWLLPLLMRGAFLAIQRKAKVG